MDSKVSRVQVLQREELYRGRVFRLDREQVVLGNGEEVRLDLIRHPGASAVLPIAGEADLLMVRQYRHAVGDFIWEIPAGTLDQGEDPMVCAHRELAEETGFRARSMEKIGEITPLPGYSDERIHLFLATGLVEARQHLDADEWLDVRRLPIETVMEMSRDGRIQDGKTLCALFFFQNGHGLEGRGALSEALRRRRR